MVPATASAATATVQIEGEFGTLVPAQSWTIGSGASTDPGSGCPANTVSAAIEAVTAGNWDRQLFIETIKGETHTFGAREEYWSLWQNNDYGNLGACSQTVSSGDHVLVQATLSGPSPDWIPESKPVELIAPAVVDEGVPFNVTVKEWAPLTTNSMPVLPSVQSNGVGYVVSDGTATSTTTGSTGVATLTLTGVGNTTIKATSTDPDNWGRSIDVPICVDDGFTC
ncbi:MAG: hypothetical protein WC558_15865, partial [Patulibacter sp.]